MNLLKAGLLFASVLFAFSAHAERQIAEIFQPTSLLGTDTEDEPLKDGQAMAATILSRPILIGGAFPESPVMAMCLPHKITGATDGFPRESNLIVLVGAKISAEFGEKSHSVIADFSHAKVSEDLGVSLIQVMQLTAECLNRNLRGGDTPIEILWKTPKRSGRTSGYAAKRNQKMSRTKWSAEACPPSRFTNDDALTFAAMCVRGKLVKVRPR